MTISALQSICKKLKGTTEDIKWGDHLCFNVGDKMYLVTNPDLVPSSASFKVSDEEFEEVSARPGFAPHTYLKRYKWVQVDDISRLSARDWEYFIHQSYRLVASKLPLKIRKTLDL